MRKENKRPMQGKNTDDLNRELMTSPDIDSYIKDNQAQFTNSQVTEILTELYEQKRMSKAELARRACMSEVYLHQLFSGRRKPSRDKLLCLCIGMNLKLDEAQWLLRQGEQSQLYPRLKRDAIISYGIVHHLSIGEVNDKLFSENEKALC